MAGTWKRATVIWTGKVASNVMALRFSVEGWQEAGGHKAGQHVDVRLTSSDGYMAERSYSIANAPDAGEGYDVELGVELLENGEVSPYLWQLKPGDAIEMRGPIGGHFIWDESMPDPLVLIAGGAGMVPLMSMLRRHVAYASDRPLDPAAKREVVCIASLRTIDRLLYAEELADIEARFPHIKIVVALTEASPLGWKGYSRRIDTDMFKKEIGALRSHMPDVYVCGPTKFVEAAANLLLSMGFNSHSIRTERFGG